GWQYGSNPQGRIAKTAKRAGRGGYLDPPKLKAHQTCPIEPAGFGGAGWLDGAATAQLLLLLSSTPISSLDFSDLTKKKACIYPVTTPARHPLLISSPLTLDSAQLSEVTDDAPHTQTQHTQVDAQLRRPAAISL
ncbi:hypothetical protein PIB30_054955, partial [Stylosanthes scabra]|nr:hypothetical protein [Stylosanthes scabra]